MPTSDPVARAWADLDRRLDAAGSSARALPVDPVRAAHDARLLPDHTDPVLRAVATRTGGLLVDHGWFRLLGGPAPQRLGFLGEPEPPGLPDLAQANGLVAGGGGGAAPLLIGFDALGGRFGIQRAVPGEVCYFGPDTLQWDGLGGGYAAFVHALLDGALGEVFDGLRWPGWEVEVAALPLDRALDVVPPLFTRAGQDIAAAQRRAVPLQEVTAFLDGVAAELDDLDDRADHENA